MGQRPQSRARVSCCCSSLCPRNAKIRGQRHAHVHSRQPASLRTVGDLRPNSILYSSCLRSQRRSARFLRARPCWPPAFTGFNLFGCSDVNVIAGEVNAAFAASQVVELMCHVGLRGQNGTGFGPDDVCISCCRRFTACSLGVVLPMSISRLFRTLSMLLLIEKMK